jgi:hypothetical protein
MAETCCRKSQFIQAATGLPRDGAVSTDDLTSMCAAQYFLLNRRRLPLEDLLRPTSHTTLVLELRQPDFSTDAGNSALISKRNLRATAPCHSA